jgi:hypothetical protein
MSLASDYKSLTDEQRGIVDQKQVTLNHSVDDLLSLLRPVAKLDAAAGRSSSQLGCSIGLLVVGTVLGLILAPTPFNLIIAAACIAGIVLLAQRLAFNKRIDVSDNLGGFAVPMLMLLREDFDPETPVNLRLDLRSPTAKEKCLGKGEPYKRGAYYKIIDTTYKDEWLSGEAKLADGSRLRWSVTDLIRESRKSKKMGGKYKTKTKTKKKSTIDVELTLRKKTWDVTAGPDDKVKESEKATTIKASRKFAASSSGPIPLDPLLETITAIYAAARPAK